MSGNQLFPVFLKLDQLKLLVIGGGNVGHEKVSYMFRHVQNNSVTVLAEDFGEPMLALAKDNPGRIVLLKKTFESSDLDGVDIVMAATDNLEVDAQIREECRKRKLLVNVADTPDLCDFYLSSVVKKGDLKIAISSNGKSPTMTKRIKELLNSVIPEEIDELIDRLGEIRDQLTGDFDEKVKTLDEITSNFGKKKD